MRASLSRCLEDLECDVVATDSAVGALDAVEHRVFDLAFVDPILEMRPGGSLAARLLEELPRLSIILIEGCGKLGPKAFESVRGNYDHLPMTFTPGQIKQFVDRFREQRNQRRRLEDCERQLRLFLVGAGIVAESAAMRNTLAVAMNAAGSTQPVVLCGEFGTERESLARFIHRNSARAIGPFVSTVFRESTDEDTLAQLVGLGDSPANGRRQGHLGIIEEAEGGSLFLADCEELSPVLYRPLQRLLRAGEFQRIGELRVRRASVRIVASTEDSPASSRPVLGVLFGEGCHAIRIDVPPLRERREDILPLARQFVNAFARRMHKGPLFLAENALEAMMLYKWPGNVAELRNAIEYAVIHCRPGTIEARDLPDCATGSSANSPRLGGDFTLDEIEREHIRLVTRRATNELVATEILGISRSTLWRRRERSELSARSR
jgi:NtrC-family two-component system response regulator AlgB